MAVYSSTWEAVNGTVPVYSAPPPETVYSSEWGTASGTVAAVQTADWWKIKNGKRVPLRVRDRLNPGQIRRLLTGKEGTFFPDASNTGPHTPSLLQVIDGDVYLDTPGEWLVDKWVRGRVFCTAPDCGIDNSRITGPASGPAAGALVVATNANVSGFLIQDTEIAPQHPNDRINCFEGHNTTFRRVNAHHGVDIVGAIGRLENTHVNIRLESVWFHDMVMFNTDTQSDNITHNDLIQWHGLLGVNAIGPRLEAFCDPGYGVVLEPPTWGPVNPDTGKAPLISGNPNYPFQTGFSVFMASPPRKLMGEFSLKKAWVDGGAVGLNFGGPTIELFPNGGVVEDVWFGDGFRHGPDYGILTLAARPMTITRAYRWNKNNPFDTSTLINPRKNGG